MKKLPTLSLQDIVEDYSRSDKSISAEERDLLLSEYVEYKGKVERKRELLLSRTWHCQNSLRDKIDSLRKNALRDFLERRLLKTGFFSPIDLSFLRLPSGSGLRWALFDVFSKTDEFMLSGRLRYEWSSSCLPPGGRLQRRHFPSGVFLEITVTPNCFGHLFVDEYGTPRDRYWKGDEESAIGKVLIEIGEKEVYRQYPVDSDKARYLNVDAYVEYKVCLDHFIPESVIEKIELFRDCFDETFFLCEIPDWEPAVRIDVSPQLPSRVPSGDPLLIGKVGQTYVLLDAFDLSNAEEYIAQEFTF